MFQFTIRTWILWSRWINDSSFIVCRCLRTQGRCRKLLHLCWPLQNPLLNNWPLKSLLTGINRASGSTVTQKLPITPKILRLLHSQQDHSESLDSSFWAICLVAFYGMFRKSHLLPTTLSSFNPKKQLNKSDYKIYSWGALVTIRWSKTIQFRERVVDIPLPRIPGSLLFPTSALYRAFSFTAPVSSRDQQAFHWVDQSFHTGECHIMMQQHKLRHHLSTLGLDPKNYAGHSFRRELGVHPLPIFGGSHWND